MRQQPRGLRGASGPCDCGTFVPLELCVVNAASQDTELHRSLAWHLCSCGWKVQLPCQKHTRIALKEPRRNRVYAGSPNHFLPFVKKRGDPPCPTWGSLYIHPTLSIDQSTLSTSSIHTPILLKELRHSSGTKITRGENPHVFI